MNIGFVALGKLGLPCAVAATQRGHHVWGYDPAPHVRTALEATQPSRYIHDEPGIDEMYRIAMEAGRFTYAETLEKVVTNCDLILLSPETPHPPRLDGSVRFYHAREDFDYAALKRCVRQVAEALARTMSPTDEKALVIVSTVLPQTTRKFLAPRVFEKLGDLFKENVALIYSPSFIAQSTVVTDYHAPEFALIGVEDPKNPPVGLSLYTDYLATIHDAPQEIMSWESAEMAKVCYNTFIGTKIVLANTVMEMCERLGAGNALTIMRTLQKATDRIVSPAYMLPGMGDGGGCHPRDNIAMAALSEKLGLPYNIFDFMMSVREYQTDFLAEQAADAQTELGSDEPIWILGKAFKPGVSQTVGSPAVLLRNILEDEYLQPVVFWDPDTGDTPDLPNSPAVFVVANPNYRNFPAPAGSVFIDPWHSLGQH